MIKNLLLIFFVFTFVVKNATAQAILDSTVLNKVYFSVDEALINPEMVYKLNLSNQKLQIPDSVWIKFTNLQYLSFKNDHLKEVPLGIAYLKNLKVLDLSGNDFRDLSLNFASLNNLEELFLNDEKYFQFEKNIPILSALPNLKSLHIENDGLKTLPKNIYKLSHIESLYLNHNKFTRIPIELKGLKNLQYLEFQDNKFRMPAQNMQNQSYGYKIKF